MKILGKWWLYVLAGGVGVAIILAALNYASTIDQRLEERAAKERVLIKSLEAQLAETNGER